MDKIISSIRSALLALAACALLLVASPAGAQQPVNPTASSVKEQQLLQELQRIQGRGTIPDTKSYIIEQPVGLDWRHFHEVTLRWIGAISIIGMLGLIVVFYLVRGMIRLESGRSGRVLVRFNMFERLLHWMTAVSFIVLAITGLNITFGKPLLLPLMSPEAFTAWSQWAKYAHNYVSFAFTLGVILIFLTMLPWNFPTRVDVQWLKEGGGLVGHRHPPADRFNAGQKMVYWLQVFAGVTLAVTGYLLMFPFYGTTIAGMQLSEIIHGITAVLFVALMLAHIYIGSIGMEGAFEGMWDGTVDENWAREHHRLWLEREVARGRAAPPPPAAHVQPAE